MDGVPAEVWAAVSGNVIVQWFLVVIFILTVGTNTATKLKGPFGSLARKVRSIGQERENREAEERRIARRKLLAAAAEGREYIDQEIGGLRAEIEVLYANQRELNQLIREHMGWDHDRVAQLIGMGVRPGDIPTPPPLRVPWPIPAKKPINGTPGADALLT